MSIRKTRFLFPVNQFAKYTAERRLFLAQKPLNHKITRKWARLVSRIGTQQLAHSPFNGIDFDGGVWYAGISSFADRTGVAWSPVESIGGEYH